MAAPNSLTGGAFQDSLGNLLDGGNLVLTLNQDATVNGNTLVCSGYEVTIPLNSNGDVVTSPAYSVWPNDQLIPYNPPISTPNPAGVSRLGVAFNYALLASSGITNSGTSVITGGNIGSSPITSITGFPPGTLTAPAVINNGAAGAAQTSLAAAITYYQQLTPTLSGLSNLSTGGNGSTASTYTAGNYFGASSLSMPTGIILDAQSNPNAIFVFVAGSTINLASGQSIQLINGAQAANVFFIAGSSFTAVSGSIVNGNILAVISITLGGGVLNGRALANQGAVTISTATTVTVPFSGTSGVSPLTTFYTAIVYSAAGERVWGPVYIKIPSVPSPFDLGTLSP